MFGAVCTVRLTMALATFLTAAKAIPKLSAFIKLLVIHLGRLCWTLLLE
jgi:hypothetical protein